MGRSTDLIYAFSESIAECVNTKYENTIQNHKMLFWKIIDDELYPLVYDFNKTMLNFENFELAKSSAKHINKFNGSFNNDFCFISETAIDELAVFLKMFDSYNLKYNITDSQSGGEWHYTIIAISDEKKVHIRVEITDIDYLMDRSTTDFYYYKE